MPETFFLGESSRQRIGAGNKGGSKTSRSAILEQAKNERLMRELARRQLEAALLIQSFVRAHLSRLRVRAEILPSLDGKLEALAAVSATLRAKGTEFAAPRAVQVELSRKFIFGTPTSCMLNNSNGPRRVASACAMVLAGAKKTSVSPSTSLCSFTDGNVAERASYTWICSSLLERALSLSVIDASSSNSVDFIQLIDCLTNPAVWGGNGSSSVSSSLLLQRQVAAVCIAQRVFTSVPAMHVLQHATLLLSSSQAPNSSSSSSSTFTQTSLNFAPCRGLIILAHRALGIFPGCAPNTFEVVSAAQSLPIYTACVERWSESILALPGLTRLTTYTGLSGVNASMPPPFGVYDASIAVLKALQLRVSTMSSFEATTALANLFEVFDTAAFRQSMLRDHSSTLLTQSMTTPNEALFGRDALFLFSKVSNALLHRSPRFLFAFGSFNDTSGNTGSISATSSSSSSSLDDENDGEDNEKQELVNVNFALEASRRRAVSSYARSLEAGVVSDEGLAVSSLSLSVSSKLSTVPVAFTSTTSTLLLRQRSGRVFLGTLSRTRRIVSTALRERSFALFFDSDLQRQLARIPSSIRSLNVLVASLSDHQTSDSDSNSGLAFVSLLCAVHHRLTLAGEILVGPMDPRTARPVSVRTGGRRNRKPLEAATLLLTSLFSLSNQTNASNESLSTSPLALVWSLIQKHPQLWKFTTSDASGASVEFPDLTATLTLFFDALAHALFNTSDLDFQADAANETFNVSLYGRKSVFRAGRFPISFSSLTEILALLKLLLYRLFWADRAALETPLNKRPQMVLELMARALKSFNALFDKHSRIVSRISVSSSSFSSASSSSSSISSPTIASSTSSPMIASFGSSTITASSSSPSSSSRWPWTDDDFLWPSVSQSEFSPSVILGLTNAVVDDEAMEAISIEALPTSVSQLITSEAASASSAAGAFNGMNPPPSAFPGRDSLSMTGAAAQVRGHRSQDDMGEGEEDVEDEDEEQRASGEDIDAEEMQWGDEFIAPSLPPPPSFPSQRSRFDRAMQGASRAQLTLTSMPQVLPFKIRVELLERLRQHDKEQAGYDMGNFMMGGGGGPDVHISVRRTNLVDDALTCFSRLSLSGNLSRAFKKRFRIQFIRADGTSEPGIDGGGLLKEFIDSVVRDAFSPERGLFCETPDHFAYPDPTLLEAAAIATAASGIGASAPSSATQQALLVFELLGLLLGKALYDGILVAPRFARFVLRKMLGRANTIDDLASYDAELHQSLMSVTRMASEYIASLNSSEEENSTSSMMMMSDPVESLALTFSVTTKHGRGASSHITETSLIEKGDEIAVTSFNVNEYIRLVCDHRLNRQIQAPVRAFLRGFHEVIPLTWIRMFSADELQLLLSGREVGRGGFDLADWRRSSTYAGFEEGEYYIHIFWSVVAALDPDDQAKLLAFVTSVPRPPLLGFSALTPRFCVRRMDTSLALERGGHEKGSLPQAHTCFNQLDLPVYESEEELKEKLLIAIRNSAGFELT
jgi:hypothetical protein